MICYNYYITDKQQGELYMAQELLNLLSARSKEFYEVLGSFKAKCYIHVFIYSKEAKEYILSVWIYF